MQTVRIFISIYDITESLSSLNYQHLSISIINQYYYFLILQKSFWFSSL